MSGKNSFSTETGQTGQNWSLTSLEGLTAGNISGCETGRTLSGRYTGKKKIDNIPLREEDLSLLKNFTTWLNVKGYKPRGIEEKERAVKQYLEYARNTGLSVSRAGSHDAESYREYLRLMTDDEGGGRYNPKTINGRIAYLRLFYQYLTSAGTAYRNPFQNIDRMKESQTIPKNILNIDEMNRLLENIPVETPEDVTFKVIIEILYSTGLRISELEQLVRADVHPGAGYMVVRDDKSRRDRNVPLTEYSAKLLFLYLENVTTGEQGHIFRRGKARTLNRWVNDRLKRLTEKLGLPLLTCHGIRHTVATHLLKKGADIREVQEILGHRRIRNTEVYTRVFPEDLKAVIEKSHPRENPPNPQGGHKEMEA